jgi:RNA polymerase sigma-70 factor (ECF subfamily)
VRRGPEDKLRELEQLSNERLFERFQAGDNAASYVLFERFHAMTWAMVAAANPNEEWVEDTVQTVFLTALDDSRTFRAESSFETWYRRLAQNVLVNELKTLQRRAAEEQFAEDTEVGDDDVVEAVVKRDLQVKVLGQLSRLSGKLREAVVLRVFGGQTYQEMSRKTNVKPGTLRWRVSCGLRLIRERLARHDAELGD